MTSWILLLLFVVYLLFVFVFNRSSGPVSHPFLTAVGLELLTCPLSLVFCLLVGFGQREGAAEGERKETEGQSICLPDTPNSHLPVTANLWLQLQPPVVALTPQCAPALTVAGCRILHPYMLVTLLSLATHIH